MPYSSISQYRGNQISSASPEKTVLMLYDGAIRFLNDAINETQVNNIPEKARLVEKTVKIVEYLQSCLDKERGGEISENLDKLYQYMAVKLTEANLKNDASKMEEVKRLLQTIREGWNDICCKNSPEALKKAVTADTTQNEKKVGIKA